MHAPATFSWAWSQNIWAWLFRGHVVEPGMGKLNVALLRYLSREDFRVLTAVSLVISRSRSTKDQIILLVLSMILCISEDNFFMF